MNPNINTFPIPDAGKTNNAIHEHEAVMAPASSIGVVPGQPSGAAVQAAQQTPSPVPEGHTVAASITKASTATETEAEFEKRWVAKAKTIMAHTKYDPYLQSSELSKAGREYRNELRQRS